MQSVVNQLERAADFFERLAQQAEAEEQNRANVRRTLTGEKLETDMTLPNLLYSEAENCRKAITQIREEV